MSAWASLHVFYELHAMEELLCECVRPLVRSLLDSGRARGWFFIRYQEDGPHLRLRLRAGDPACAREVEAEARRVLETWVAAHPSTRPAQPRGPARRHADNSVQSIPYLPETERYGGPAALPVSEAHFQDSSQMVLRLVERTRRSPRGAADRYLGAVQLAAMTALSAGVPRARLSAWFADTLTHVRWPTTDPGDAYRDFLRRNRNVFAARLDAVAHLYEEDAPAASAEVEAWMRGTGARCRQLAGLLDGSADTGWNPELELPQKYVLIVQSWIHMTFNRLGFWAVDELFLLRLLRDLTALPEVAAPGRTNGVPAHA